MGEGDYIENDKMWCKFDVVNCVRLQTFWTLLVLLPVLKIFIIWSWGFQYQTQNKSYRHDTALEKRHYINSEL